MTLLVSDTRSEEFSKPPPKKKWLAEYIEKDSSKLEANESKSISMDLSSDAKDFVRLFDNKVDNLNLSANLEKLSKDGSKKAPMTLSQEVIGGVVEGVLNQFQSFFENSCMTSDSASFHDQTSPRPSKTLVKSDKKANNPKVISNTQKKPLPLVDAGGQSLNSSGITTDPKISQHEIVPVVQSVISQFLNGNLSESEFRRSRKRSHKHANSHHRDKSSSGGHGAAERVQRSSSVIQFKSSSVASQNPIRPVIERPQCNLHDEALNLSLPKVNTGGHHVTFASQDRCYSTESVKSLQVSKSQELTNMDRLAHPVSSEPSISHLPVIQHSTKPISYPKSSSWPSHQSSTAEHFTQSLPCSRQTSPLRLIKDPHLQGSSSYNPSPVPSPPPLQVIQRTSVHPKLKPDMYTPQYMAIKPKPVKEVNYSDLPSEVTNNQPKTEAKRSNTREVHNRLEKNRRAQLKKCFEELASECDLDAKKASNLTVIRSAHKYIMTLKRQERENEKSLASLVQEKIRKQQQLELLKKEFPGYKSESDCE